MRVTPKFVSESPMCTKYRMLLVVEEFQRILFQLSQVHQYKLININKYLTRTVQMLANWRGAVISSRQIDSLSTHVLRV